MYNLFKKIIYSSALAGITIYSSVAMSETFTIQSFKFSMQQPDFSDLGGPQGAAILPGPYGTIVEGVYQGSNTTNDLVNFKFFGATVNVYTAATNQGSTNTAGSTITGGPAPTFDLVNGTADMSSWFAHWSGTEFLQGNNNNHAACASNPNVGLLSSGATVVDNFDGTYKVNWNSCISTAPFVGQIGFWQLNIKCDSCVAVTTPGPSDTLVATQGGQTTRNISPTGGPVVITSSLGVTPVNTTFAWVSETDVGITDTDSAEGTFTFDPTSLAVGNYSFSTIYTDATNPLILIRGQGSINLRVVVADAGVDINDSNNNGIINEYDDPSLAETQLQAELSNGTSFVLNTDKGKLKLGSASSCAGKASRITLADMAAFAGPNCTAITNSTDDPSFINTGIGGYHDFEIHNLIFGETATVVIPLNEDIPANAVYRKYNKAGTWATFNTSTGDTLSTAKATSTGVCPAADSADYTSGLTAGDNCLRLTIADGGENDADSAANGQILDPGTIAVVQSGTEAELGSGCSISGNPQNLNEHSEWILLASFIAWFGFISYRNKKRAE